MGLWACCLDVRRGQRDAYDTFFMHKHVARLLDLAHAHGYQGRTQRQRRRRRSRSSELALALRLPPLWSAAVFREMSSTGGLGGSSPLGLG